VVNIDVRPEVPQRFPEFSCHALLVFFPKNLKISSAKLDHLDQLINKAISSWPDPISELEAVSVWRRAFKMMGLKPTKTLSSVEALIKLAKKNRWKTGNTVVDIYNAFSIINAAPLGGYDIDSFVEPTITVRNAMQSKDIFFPLGGDSEKYKLTSDVVVYAQGCSVLCWGINHKDSKVFSIKESSRNLLFVSEGISDLHADISVNTLCQLKEFMKELGADCSEVSSIFGRGHIVVK